MPRARKDFLSELTVSGMRTAGTINNCVPEPTDTRPHFRSWRNNRLPEIPQINASWLESSLISASTEHSGTTIPRTASA